MMAKKHRTSKLSGLIASLPAARPGDRDAWVLKEARFRARLLLAGIGGFLLVLSARAANLTVQAHPELENLGGEQFQAAVEIKGRRGAIYDRRGRVLASTVDLPTLYANPKRLHAPELLAGLQERIPKVAALVGRPEAEVATWFEKRGSSGEYLREIKLGDALEPTAARELLVGLPRDAMWIREEPVRFYPGRELAAPLLGFTDSFGYGAAGLERVLERDLAGVSYRVMVSHDRKGRSVEPGLDAGRLAREGNSVRLTLDAAIQHATERALHNAMLASVPEAAMAVVVEVKTGAVLAIASVPGGNPNDGASRAEHDNFKNRPAMDQVEPGSVMKPFIAAAAIEEGLVTADTMIDCELGSWFIGGRTIRDDHPKGVISVSEVIKFSSNVGAAKLGFMLGPEKMLNYLKDFGFARRTGLGLPGEVAGAMRSAATIRTIEMATTSFGQGVTSSPIQLASAIATIANGGVRMYPRLVEEVLDRHGDVETTREPRVDRRVLSEETAKITTRMMETVIESGGTGTRASVPGYLVAGKTGTAQKVENGVYSPTKRVSAFVGYLPADRPEIAMAVVVDTPTVGSKYGGIVAAPVFAEVGRFAMAYLGIAPDPALLAAERSTLASTAALQPDTAPETLKLLPDGQGAWILPDLHGRSLRDSLAGLQAAGFSLRVEGYGVLVEQSPAPGARVRPGDEVRLRFN